MNEQRPFDSNMAPGTGIKSILANPLAVATKPPVIFKFASAMLSLIIYFCIVAAWYQGRCLFNKYNGICRFGSLSLISFIACTILLLLEISFHHISSYKVRRRIAITDVICSGINTIFFLLLFLFSSLAWLKSDYPPFGQGINCCRFAVLLSLLAIFAQAACTGLAYVRNQSSSDTSQFMTEDQLRAEQSQYYDYQGNPTTTNASNINDTSYQTEAQQLDQYGQPMAFAASSTDPAGYMAPDAYGAQQTADYSAAASYEQQASMAPNGYYSQE